MPKKRSEKYIRDTDTLRLIIDYRKFTDIDDCILAFNLLNRVTEKSKYICESINYYEHIAEKDILRELDFYLEAAKFIANYYSLIDRTSVEMLLSIPDESATYKNLMYRRIDFVTPKNFTLGFSKSSRELSIMHSRLYSMPVNDRILLISNAVNAYVKDKQDSGAFMQLSYSFLYEVIRAYRASENKEKIVDELCKLMNIY